MTTNVIRFPDERQAARFYLNGWTVFRTRLGDWVIADVNPQGGYREFEMRNSKRAAIRYAETHTPDSLLKRPRAEIVRLAA